MLGTATALSQIRSHYEGEARDLLRVLMNATSAAEANLALDALGPLVPAKVLVQACNLREVLSALPASPFAMRVDESTLAEVTGYERGIAAMSKTLPDGLTLSATTAGNLVLDIIVKVGERKHFWNPVPVKEDYVSSDMLDEVVSSDHLLDEVIELAKSMGMVFNPKFYFSLEDWLLESAADAYDDIVGLF